MKLSDLLKVRDDLLALDLYPTKESHRLLEMQARAINFTGLALDPAPLLKSFSELPRAAEQIEQQRSLIVSNLEAAIYQRKQEYFSDCELKFVNPREIDARTNREVRKLDVSDSVRSIVKSRLGQYLTWETAGLEIGPGDGTWTNELVAQDPLYVVDVHDEFLRATVSKFPQEYRNRIRPYKTDGINFNDLPKSQMGLIFAWNVFNYFTRSYADRVLGQVKRLLRPGGVLIFSYNNADRYQSAQLFESGQASFLPKRELNDLIRNHGLEIVANFDYQPCISWIEVRMPGELSTNRAGQTLARVSFK
jgi:SAM-dependent methyltransferase